MITSLTLTGDLNGTDILFIRSKLPLLRILDLENAIIVSGGVAYYGDMTTTDNQIGDYTFYDCSRLTSITIPTSVTSIGFSAFSDCSGFTSFTIPDGLTLIGDNALVGCSGLKEIHNNNANPQIVERNVFQGIDTTTCILYVPEGSFSSYQAAVGWSDFTTILEEDITSNPQIQTDKMKVYTEAEAIVIEGAEPGEQILVYTESGALVQTIQATRDIVRINVPGGNTYLIKTAGKTFKIAL